MEGHALTRRARLLGAAALVLLLAGCADTGFRRADYTWGSYEELIYGAYAKPGEVPPERQIELMEADYQKGRAANQRMPPGWHAQLGWLYYQVGRDDQAQQEFLTEKADFPESAVLMDRLLKGPPKPAAAPPKPATEPPKPAEPTS